MAKVDIEHYTSAMRVWSDDGAQYGDPYDLSVAVRWLGKEEVELTLLRTRPSGPMWRAIQDALAEIGVKRFLMKRIKNGKVRERWIETECRSEGSAKLPDESPDHPGPMGECDDRWQT